MGDRIANLKALGFGAFAIGWWIYSLPEAGWTAPGVGDPTVVQWVTLVVLASSIVGLASLLRNETWYAVFFLFWAAILWGSHATLSMTMAAPTAYNGWYDMALAVISLLLLLSALRIAAGPAVVLLNLGSTLVFLVGALGTWSGAHFWAVLAGYLGLITGLAALWAAWNEFAAIGGEAGAA
jgi:succinate-acetate transporter protein